MGQGLRAKHRQAHLSSTAKILPSPKHVGLGILNLNPLAWPSPSGPHRYRFQGKIYLDSKGVS